MDPFPLARNFLNTMGGQAPLNAAGATAELDAAARRLAELEAEVRELRGRAGGTVPDSHDPDEAE